MRELDVLIVGCGCSGSLVARLFRGLLKRQALSLDRLPKRARNSHVRLSDHVTLTMWDWARGPAGRMASFCSTLDNQGKHVADVGAQVLSVRGPVDEEYLRAYGAIDAFGLALTTGERPRDATHLWMPGGLSQLLAMQIRDSCPDEIEFNRRVSSIACLDQQYVVEAELNSPPHWLARGSFQTGRYHPEYGQCVVKQSFDAVVVATTASDVLRLHGLAGALGSTNVAALKKVLYDSRLSVTLVLSSTLTGSLEGLFTDGQAELDFESCSRSCGRGVLGLLAWQDRKDRQHSDYTLIVAHSTRKFARENLNEARLNRQTPEERGVLEVKRALALQLQIGDAALQDATLECKAIHWHQGQVQRFMSGDDECLVVPSYMTMAPQPLLVLCGDYFTEATFSGCSRSARAAARALKDWLQTRVTESEICKFL